MTKYTVLRYPFQKVVCLCLVNHLKVETKNSEKMHLNYAVNVDLLVNTLLSIPCKELSWSAGSGEIDFF